jgi:shikimate kinase
MRIFLTGFMGAGKSSVGERLGARLDLPFVDLDEEIERRAGASIREIFERGGEPEFRRLEHRTLVELLAAPDLVMAVGGGTVTVEASAALLHEGGLVVWLNPPFATIVERIGALGKRDRPLFRDEVQAWELYRARLPAYRRCDLEVGVDPSEGPEEVAARIALWAADRR